MNEYFIYKENLNIKRKLYKLYMPENYYEILGVSQDADENEIKRAYMKLSLKHHPDRNEDKEEATRRFQEISSAYETLKDKQTRQTYDHELKYGIGSGGSSMEAEMHDINNIFNMMFGGGFPGGGFPGGGFPGGGFPGHGFSMNGPYPGMGQGFPGAGMPGVHVFQMGPGMGADHIFQQLQKPAPIIKNIEIGLELAYFGGSYNIDIERNIIKNGIRVIEIETINIDIVQGITENEIIVLRNRGNMLNENIIGDIKICVNILENDTFKRIGNDLIYQKKLSLKEALCGFSLEIRHLNGKILNMNNIVNPAIIKPGYKKVVQNMGMIRNLQTGNLIIEFDLVFPDKLDQSQINILKQVL
uniref:J domain-containing protein n=1 Tax=viral metagenome TaxID=1070528 RepID=A0A6C0HZG9_9ZZZZ